MSTVDPRPSYGRCHCGRPIRTPGAVECAEHDDPPALPVEYASCPDYPHAYPCEYCSGGGCRQCGGTGERTDPRPCRH